MLPKKIEAVEAEEVPNRPYSNKILISYFKTIQPRLLPL